jgi:hypothetical protein
MTLVTIIQFVYINITYAVYEYSFKYVSTKEYSKPHEEERDYPNIELISGHD